MASVKRLDLLTGSILILFLSLCFYLHQQGGPGPWHSTATSLWEKEDWRKLQALGENLFRVQRVDPEAFYLAMMASQQSENPAQAQVFAERLSRTRVLNWKMESELARIYQPDSLWKRIRLFRTRIVYGILLILFAILMVSIFRKKAYRAAPIALAAVGMLALLL